MPKSHKRTLPRVRGIDNRSRATCSGCTYVGNAFITKTFCPRHDAPAYAEYMARHATDSIRPVAHVAPVDGCDCADCREYRFHASNQWGR